jgi:hypothetical protein
VGACLPRCCSNVVKAAVVSLAVLVPLEVAAVFTNIGDISYLQPQHSVRLRVGSPSGVVDSVGFTIPGDTVGSGKAILQDVSPGANAALVQVEIQARTMNPGDRTVLVTVTTPSGLCHSAGCTAAIIPMTEIAWTSLNVQTGGADGNTAQGGIDSGVFAATTTTTLLTFPSGQRAINSLQFRFLNTTLFPAGTYSGRVTFTASMP